MPGNSNKHNILLTKQSWHRLGKIYYWFGLLPNVITWKTTKTRNYVTSKIAITVIIYIYYT
jgi:hypothetical protein